MQNNDPIKSNLLQKLAIILFLIPFSLFIIIRALLLNLLTKRRKFKYKKGDLFDIICISHVDWIHVWQRNHHTMTRLAKRHKVIYCKSEVAHVVIKYPKILTSMKLQQFDNVIWCKFLRLSGESRSEFIYRLNKFILKAELLWLMQKYDFRNIILWFYFPVQANLSGSMNELITVYDIQDNYSAFLWAPRNIDVFERSLLGSADVVFTGTYALYEKNKSFSNNIHFFPCGVEFNHFRQKDNNKIPDDIKNINNPILGYIGFIDDRIDVELLEYMARVHKDWNLVMIGPIDRKVFRIPNEDNIYFLDSKNYKLLPYYIQKWDVCLMPFAITELTKNINPTKTLEYFATGKPVVSTAIPDIIKYYSDILGVAYSKEEFVKLCEEALSHSQRFKIEEGIELARKNSWETMVENMERLIVQEIDRKYSTF